MPFFFKKKAKNYDLDDLLERQKKKMGIKGTIDTTKLKLNCDEVIWKNVKDLKLNRLQGCGAAPISVDLGTTVILESGHVSGLHRQLILPLKDFPEELQKLVGVSQIEIFIGDKTSTKKTSFQKDPRSLRQNCQVEFKCQVFLEGVVKFTSSKNDRTSVDELDASEIRGRQSSSKKKKVEKPRPFSKKLNVKGTCTFHLGQTEVQASITEVINNRVINNRVISNRVINNRVINNRVINKRVINYRVINNRVINNRVINNGVINNRVINKRVINNIF
ncbi:unnamed protein product [Lymnaea stagnalis]|uniref:Uncharacterized protein n=1 Tax=Lymnaea stagnalis TaxID=6523 RepID=A0AAV2HNX8_LYMST